MFWIDAWKLGSSFWANAQALQETAFASHGVIDARSRTIDAAMRNPLQADMAELGRMVPEKLAAFGEAGSAMTKDWLEMQDDMLAQGRDMMSLFTSWPPNGATIERIGRRGSGFALKMSAAGGRALAPVHAAATANHRRLGTAKRRATRK
jgi:hypothetical protein